MRSAKRLLKPAPCSRTRSKRLASHRTLTASALLSDLRSSIALLTSRAAAATSTWIEVVIDHPHQFVETQIVQRVGHVLGPNPAVVDVEPRTFAVGTTYHPTQSVCSFLWGLYI